MTRRRWPFFLALSVLYGLLLTTIAARPPTLPSPLPVVTGDPLLDHAERVALAVLSANQDGAVHRAAPFYAEPWIRDSYAWGMVPDDRGTLFTYAHTELAYWLGHQQPFGGWITFPYSGWYDETPIMIAAVLDAYRQTGDLSMVRRALPAVRRAWRWLDTSYVDPRHGSHCLLWVTVRPRGVHFASDWADQVLRIGYTPQIEGLWYRATHALAALEALAGSRAAARNDDRTASCIAADTNHLLWHVEAPAHYDAQPLPAFGHYRAVPATWGYFELDGNALLLTVGVASAENRSEVLNAVAAHARYLLGAGGAGPARVLYGDYAAADYGPIHNWMGSGLYQNAYWPSVGGLLALAAARNDDVAMAITVLDGLAQRADDANNAFHEWYSADGTPEGAAQYGWGARMYLLALYRAYLGVDDSASTTAPADLVLRAAPGSARGELVRLGKRITVVGHGTGRFLYARLGHHILRSPVVPARLLYNGAVLDVYRG